ncbi:hypothetical protein [Candidatus Nitrospira salsa]
MHKEKVDNVIMTSFLLCTLLMGHVDLTIGQSANPTKHPTIPHMMEVNNSSAPPKSSDSQSPPTIKGSEPPTTEVPYGEIFNKQSEKLPFYLQPEFGGLDGSDHRREVRPNAAGQRLDMDQYNRQVRPSVGP